MIYMGQVKKLMMEYDDVLNNLHDFRDTLNKYAEDSEYELAIGRIIHNIFRVEDLLEECRNKYNTNALTLVSDTISKSNGFLIAGLNDENLDNIRRCWTRCRLRILNESARSNIVSLNSPAYYEQEIHALNARLEALTDELKQQTSMHEEEVASKESEMRELEEQIAQFRKKEEHVKQIDDAKSTWKKAIEASFEILDGDIQPVKEEKKRLKCLYWAYCVLSVLMLGILVSSEIITIKKLNLYDGIPSFKEYLSLIVPIPIALALLFVFMTQINRAQRQMVSISKYIHDIKYIEGILLAINNLSVDIDDSMKRINNALDKLLDRHLKGEKEQLHEDDLKILENKDSIPTTQVLELLTTVLGRAEKNDKF